MVTTGRGRHFIDDIVLRDVMFPKTVFEIWSLAFNELSFSRDHNTEICAVNDEAKFLLDPSGNS